LYRLQMQLILFAAIDSNAKQHEWLGCELPSIKYGRQSDTIEFIIDIQSSCSCVFVENCIEAALLILKKITARTRKAAEIFVNKTFAIFLFTPISPSIDTTNMESLFYIYTVLVSY
jgi:hypothetical protein